MYVVLFCFDEHATNQCDVAVMPHQRLFTRIDAVHSAALNQFGSYKTSAQGARTDAISSEELQVSSNARCKQHSNVGLHT
jgi:hypothetical protein